MYQKRSSWNQESNNPCRLTFPGKGFQTWMLFLIRSIVQFSRRIKINIFKLKNKKIIFYWYSSLFWSVHASRVPAPCCFFLFFFKYCIRCALRNAAWAGKLLFSVCVWHINTLPPSCFVYNTDIFYSVRIFDKEHFWSVSCNVVLSSHYCLQLVQYIP